MLRFLTMVGPLTLAACEATWCIHQGLRPSRQGLSLVNKQEYWDASRP